MVRASTFFREDRDISSLSLRVKFCSNTPQYWQNRDYGQEKERKR